MPEGCSIPLLRSTFKKVYSSSPSSPLTPYLVGLKSADPDQGVRIMASIVTPAVDIILAVKGLIQCRAAV